MNTGVRSEEHGSEEHGSRGTHPQAAESPGHRPVEIIRVADGAAQQADDVAAEEEPLEIRLDGSAFATIMRTPGADRELAAGFLLAERLIAGPDDLGVIRHCTGPDGAQAPNVIDITLARHAATRAAEALAARRMVASSSSCGVCGRGTIEDLTTGLAPLPARLRVNAGLIASLPDALRGAQPVFDATGGLHAAALFDASGALMGSAEDVGRHNAVDKVIGAEVLMDRLPLHERLLFVSGRASYELVQKALVAGIPLLASVSAPSSLAIELARRGGLTLLGFVRGGAFNIYTGAERIELS
jgi:FdhD protein